MIFSLLLGVVPFLAMIDPQILFHLCYSIIALTLVCETVPSMVPALVFFWLQCYTAKRVLRVFTGKFTDESTVNGTVISLTNINDNSTYYNRTTVI